MQANQVHGAVSHSHLLSEWWFDSLAFSSEHSLFVEIASWLDPDFAVRRCVDHLSTTQWKSFANPFPMLPPAPPGLKGVRGLFLNIDRLLELGVDNTFLDWRERGRPLEDH